MQVRLKSHWRTQAALGIEFTEQNLDLLLEKPAPHAYFKPVITDPNVIWLSARLKVCCKYFDASSRRLAHRSFTVKFPDGATDDEKQELVNAASTKCQEVYNSHHSPPPDEGQ